jgi:hypothetical protein
MPRFVVVDTIPYPQRAIVNLDAISVVTIVNERDGSENLTIHMMDGSEIVVRADFADVENGLQATPLITRVALGPRATAAAPPV